QVQHAQGEASLALSDVHAAQAASDAAATRERVLALQARDRAVACEREATAMAAIASLEGRVASLRAALPPERPVLEIAPLADAEANGQAARAQARLLDIAQQLAEEAKRRAHETRLEGQLRLWNALVGRTGGGMLDRFRDHLVGRAGPAVSQEASRLLSRFT